MARCMIREKAASVLAGALLLLGWELPAAPAFGKPNGEPFSSGAPASVAQHFEAGKRIVKGSEIIEALKHEGETIDCSGCVIEGQLDFSDIPAEEITHADQKQMAVVIKRPLNFNGAQFKGAIAVKSPVKFLYPVKFVGARFQDHVDLTGAIFEQDAAFGDAQFGRMSSFKKATFNKRAGFRGALFDERALFDETVFKGETDFAIATFKWLAFFLESKFCYPGSEGADFLFTRFMGDTIFSRAEFDSTARFVGTGFQGPTHFSECIFRNEAWFAGGAHFDNNVTFRGAKFLKRGPVTSKKKPPRPPVLFSGVIFSWDAVFSEVQFGQVAFSEMNVPASIGRDTVFRKRADFRGAVFETLDLQRVIFQSDADFSRANLGTKVALTDVDIDQANLRLNWEQLLGSNGKPKLQWQGGYEYEKSNPLETGGEGFAGFIRFLSFLEKNFRRHEKLADAGQVHYFMEDLKRQKSGGMARILNSIFYKGIFGYGVKPWHQVLTAMLIIAGLGFAYTRKNVLRFKPAEERNFRLRITDIPINWSVGKEVPAESGIEDGGADSYIHRYWQGLSFSFYVFTKIGYGGVYVGGRCKYVALTEWVIGMAMMVSLLINLSNTLPILQRLVTGLFG